MLIIDSMQSPIYHTNIGRNQCRLLVHVVAGYQYNFHVVLDYRLPMGLKRRNNRPVLIYVIYKYQIECCY